MKSYSRVKRIILFGRCLIRAFFFSFADKMPLKISRIIVVPTGKLGDVVCATPVLKALRDKLPKAHIIVAGNTKLHKPLLADSGLVDEYLNLEEDGSIGRIKNCNADVALVTGPSYLPTALLYLAGVPLVVSASVQGGFSPSETRLYKILKRFVKTFPYHIGKYAPRERLKSLEPIGIFSDSTKKHLGFSEEASKKVKQFFVDNGFDLEKDFIVGISPTAGNKIKEWPEERFAEVADYMATKYRAKIIMLGGQNDEEKVNRTVGHMGSGIKVVKITDFNIDMLKSLIAKLALFIAVDTGPIYIAEAFRVPTIDIVGPVDERVQPPHGIIHRNVIPPDRTRSELSILNARSYNVEEAKRQVLSTSVDVVLKEIDGLLRDVLALRKEAARDA